MLSQFSLNLSDILGLAKAWVPYQAYMCIFLTLAAAHGYVLLNALLVKLLYLNISPPYFLHLLIPQHLTELISYLGISISIYLFLKKCFLKKQLFSFVILFDFYNIHTQIHSALSFL